MGSQFESWVEFFHQTLIPQANAVIVTIVSGRFIEFICAKVKIFIVVYKTQGRKGLM